MPSRATWSSSIRLRRWPRTKRRACARSALGGLVERGSVKRDGTSVSFVVTDTAKSIPVRFEGILPDLFKEGKGVVAQGQLQEGVFVAREVLAKHDENYMPPEAAEALKRAQQGNPKLAETLSTEPVKK
jgi:cytochrome c-type biogenesis protein CcmE